MESTFGKSELFSYFNLSYNCFKQTYSNDIGLLIYGNFSYHEINMGQFPDYIKVIDTPLVTGHGKTVTDSLMIVDMLNVKDQYDHYVLLTRDVDSVPVIKYLERHGKKITLLPFGLINQALKHSCGSHIDGFLISLKLGMPIETGYEIEIKPPFLAHEYTYFNKAAHLLNKYNKSDWLGQGSFMRLVKTVYLNAVIEYKRGRQSIVSAPSNLAFSTFTNRLWGEIRWSC